MGRQYKKKGFLWKQRLTYGHPTTKEPKRLARRVVHTEVDHRRAGAVRPRHRVKFLRPDGTTGSPFFGSCLVVWGDKCDRRLRESKIEGKYVVLNV